MAHGAFLPLVVGGEAPKEKKRRNRSKNGGRNVTAKARADLLKYAEEVLRGKSAGQQLADLVTFTPKETSLAKRFAKEQAPSTYKWLTLSEMQFRFKQWKFMQLFGLDERDAMSLLTKLNLELSGLQNSKQAAVEAPKGDDAAKVGYVSDWVDGAKGEGEQNQQVDLFADEGLTHDASHLGGEGLV